MYDIYLLASGPLLLVSFTLFLCGIFYKIFSIIIFAKKTESFIFTYIDFKYSIRSILHWILPFASLNQRLNPFFTVVTFIFHIFCILIPFFLLSHLVLLEEKIDLFWWYFPDCISDIMTIFVLLSLVYFFLRRLLFKEVNFITTRSDYFLLLLIFLPFFTGFIAYHQWIYYDFFLIFHIFSSEILLILLPHTRLGHMFLFFFNRSYIGSEFGKIRNAKDW